MVATRAVVVANIQMENVTHRPATITLTTRSTATVRESAGCWSLAITMIHAAAIIRPA